jgi:DNA-binding PadR family transcriptional regulator
VLSLGEASGYEIKKAFEEGPFSHIHVASFGSIYPALNTLVVEGLAEAREIEQHKRPDKIVYAITPKGRETLRLSLAAEPASDKVRSDFLFGLFFAQELTTETVAARLDDRIAWYRESLERMEGCATCSDTWAAGPKFVHGLGKAVYAAALAYLEDNRDSLIDDISDTASRMVAE